MESYWFFDQLIDVLISGEQTDGSHAVIEFWAPSGCQTPLHVHRDVDECWRVIDGELSVWIGEADVRILVAGDVARAPRGIPHTFEVTGSGDLHGLLTMLPAGFEDYVRSFGTPAQTHDLPVLDGPPDIARASELAAEHGIELLGPPGMRPTDLR